MRRLLAALACLVVLAPAPSAGADEDPVEPAWSLRLPPDTTQVIRTVSSTHWCTQVWCTVTQAWSQQPNGHWVLVKQFRSTIGSAGWDKAVEGDRRSPSGVFRIRVTFSTTSTNPGLLPWRRRLPTSMMSDEPGRLYNTWIEQPGRTSGDRPSMRWGLIINYNHPRLQVGVGPAPIQGKGTGIFMHTSRPGHAWDPTLGCTQVGNPDRMHWLLTWLHREANARIVQNL